MLCNQVAEDSPDVVINAADTHYQALFEKQIMANENPATLCYEHH